MHARSTIWTLGIALLLACASCPNGFAQDVVYLKKTNAPGESKRKGEIVNWVGDTISIKGKSGVKDFDTDQLIRFETAWHGGYEDGKRLLEEYRYDAAVDQFASALESEPRAWMQNIVDAKLVECFLAKDDFGNAARHFLRVIDDDPQSRFRHLAPLVWTSSKPNRQQLQKAEVWLESREPMIAMLGASWMLADQSNKKAKQKMERLTRDFDPVVASLAKAQVWRLDSVAPDAKRLELRIELVRSMPKEVRCGAWYLIAEAQSKSKQEDEAIVNFMRIPINDPQQGGLAAAALYQTAWLLKNTNREQQSQSLRNELKEKFGGTVWAN
ncbi:tetratricopeptide repeat protein [Mariniblastus fucicola]|uniref:Tetratricopeptide repeat protein n=1 Tax=Mariniblastus fucicola TaxID=980251 RepID=A0A5B9PIW4_9BACT|nr:hypothetical protein [Mariniblastus fucicola]QEG24602.1 hypothetical protein MFFC18_45230 [Mariniblastus fucicola]